jgi:hypothetical protein
MAAVMKFDFPKKKDIRVLEEVYKKPDAQHKADEAKDGMMGGLTRVFSNKKSSWLLTDYFLRYEPFWHVAGESFFEYMRRNSYGLTVRPEVRSVTINRETFQVDESKPVCTVEGEEHCFEKYGQEILVRASSEGKDKDELKPYVEAKSRPVAKIDRLAKKDTDVLPVETRASFLVAEMIKQLLKSVQADKIIEQRISVKKLALYFRPVHVFNYTDSESGKMKTVMVDGVTGDVYKASALVQRLKGVKPTEDTLFDVTAGLAESVIPGAGLGAIIGKKLMKRRRDKKIKQQMEYSKQAAKEKR